MTPSEFNAFISKVEADFKSPALDIETLKARVVETGAAYAKHLAHVRAQPPGYMSCNPFPASAYQQAKEALRQAVAPDTIEQLGHAAKYAR